MARVKDTLRDLDVRPSKERGQNFVIDSSVIRTIVDFGHPSADENIIEVGPGLGALTQELSQFPQLTTIEIEGRFCDHIKREFPAARVVCGDIREIPLAQFGTELTIFGNLPYVYSTDIIFYMLRSAPVIKRAVFLLQREFAERLAAAPHTKAYGRLTVATQLWASVLLGPIIPGSSFHPPTKVESALVEITFLKAPRYPVSDPLWFEKVVKASFLQRRKKLSNSLKGAGFLSAEQVESGLAQAGIDGARRAETLSIEEFVRLAEVLLPSKV